jgi:hypothetical protein
MTRPIRPRNPNAVQMKSWLPPIWYDVAYSVNALLEAEGRELTLLQRDIDSVRAARLPQTAASLYEIMPDGTRRYWALERFEEELGLEVSPPGVSPEDRLARIMARFLGIGSTIYQLRQIARAWGFGEIAVLPGVENWMLYCQFVDVWGIPGDLDAQETEIRNNVQAHLGPIQWLFHWTTWGEVRQTGLTWCQAKTERLTWDQIKITLYETLPSDVVCTPDSLDPNLPLYRP